MNPGVGEEAGKTARGLIDSLKDSPMMLAMVAFNLVFMVIIFLIIKQNRDSEEKFQTALFAQQTKTMEMLYNCTPTPKQ